MTTTTVETRAKYDAKQLAEMAKNGEAMPDESYPIKDADDLDNAIRAVGRGDDPHSTIRRHIIKRADALHMADKIPDSWKMNGALQRSAARKKARHRVVPLIPEVRYWSARDLEIRSDGARSGEIRVTGEPIVYDSWYDVTDRHGSFQERMRPGVLTSVLERGADVRFLFNHDGLPLARTTAGTMTISDGPHAARIEVRLDKRQQVANDLAIAIERGDVTQMSSGFLVSRDEWDSCYEHRTITDMEELLDFSAVTYPASPATSIAIARRMAADLRAGVVFSDDLQHKLLDATRGLHQVLAGAGFDPNDLLEDDESPDDADDPSASDQSEPTVLDDGSMSRDETGVPGSAAVTDGTATRSGMLQKLRLQADSRRR